MNDFVIPIKSFALIEIDITRGNLDPLPIAVSPFYHEAGSSNISQGDEIIKNVSKKFKVSEKELMDYFEREMLNQGK